MATHEFRNRERFVYLTEEEARSMSNYYELTPEQEADLYEALEKAEAEDKDKPLLTARMQEEEIWSDDAD
jgi:hypothetical protein